jgi:hypothetical protein
MQADRPILFVSIYYEVLKTYIPIIQHLKKKGHKIYLLAKHYPNKKDREKTQKALKELDVPGTTLESFELVDQSSWRTGQSLTNRWYRLTDTFLKGVHVSWKAQKTARATLKRINPKIIVLGSDGRTLERYLVEEADKKGIPSICFQWALTAISEKAITEGKTRNLLSRKKCFTEKFSDLLYNYLSFFVFKFNSLLSRLLGLRIKPKVKLERKFAVFGQGNATALALIGKGSYDFHIKMGTPKSKLFITGHPLYEETFVLASKGLHKTEEGLQKAHHAIKIPLNGEFILWANNDSKKQYTRFYSHNQMLTSWKHKIKCLLESDSHTYIVFKLHPAWNDYEEFKELGQISERVRIVKDINLEELLPYASILLVRHSMSAIFGLLYSIPVISFNYPPLPVGRLFKDIGGTIHVDDNIQLKEVVDKILQKDRGILERVKEEQRRFVDSLEQNKDKELQSFINFHKLIKQLTND